MEFSPLHYLLSRLEEEIEFQQKLATTYLTRAPRYSPETISGVWETLRRLSGTLRLVSLILEEFEEIEERELKEEALILSSQSLSLASIILPALERVSPVFFEGITAREKPLIEKIEDVLAEIESSLEKLELSSTRDIVRTLEEIAQYLDYSLKMGQKIVEKEL